MYIEEELWNWIEERYKKAGYKRIERKYIENGIKNCGRWYSHKEMIEEIEDFNMSLEECFNEYWFVVTKNKIKFTYPDEFANDLDNYLGIDMSMYGE